MDPQAVYDLGRAADAADAEVIVLSCTDMRSLEILSRLEQTLRKPVISSNQAMMFQTLQMVGIGDPVIGYGQLLEAHRL